ncbi:MAG TPA: hypothetical protein VK545_10190 [Streptomyces sp.]|nr:hypothetical protein [Streptomyces sp.]
MTTHPTDSSQPTAEADGWLARAEADANEMRGMRLLDDANRARRNADRINARLKELGITPERPASVDGFRLVDAVLVAPNWQHSLHGVGATVVDSDPGGDVRLTVRDYENPETVLVGRILHRIGDVAEARRELPDPPRQPAPDMRAWAMRSIDSLNANHTTVDAYAIAEAINGLTAAVLHLADVTRTNSGGAL